MNTLTYNEALQLLSGFYGLSSFTNSDGKVHHNHFGFYQVKIAQAIARLKKVENEYTDLRNDIIRSMIPDGRFEVPQERHAEASALQIELGKSSCGLTLGDLPRIPASLLEKDNIKVSIDALAQIADLINE